MALEWFELDLLSSGNPRSHPLWMDNWTEFVIELQSTFGPHNPVADTKNQLDHLQRLPDHIKDEICCVGKPCNLDDLRYLAQEINVHYWECKEEVQHANKSKSKPTTSSNANSSSGNANSSSSNKSKSSNGGNKSPNATSSNPNLAGKLGKDGKLTPEEKK
ncbi:hypothetical protein ID866_12440 [Astraeus odoratus]|nr:hypothetical protein ID866_12440 [Astraeus odoratus]